MTEEQKSLVTKNLRSMLILHLFIQMIREAQIDIILNSEFENDLNFIEKWEYIIATQRVFEISHVYFSNTIIIASIV